MRSTSRPAVAGIAIVLVLNAALAGCGAAAWPSADGLADPGFLAERDATRSIDLLPVDVQLWTDDDRDPEPLAGALRGLAVGTLTAELARRGYSLAAAIDRHGGYVDEAGARRRAMEPEALAHTRYALSSYGAAQAAAGRDALLVPFLPHRLGTATGSDATLHVGGWAFAGERPRSRGATVALVVVGVLLVAVGVAAALASKGKGGGSIAGGLGRAVGGVGRVAGRVVGIAGRAAASAARVPLALGRAALRSGDAVHLMLHVGDALEELEDAHGHPRTHIAHVAARPDYAVGGAPRDGRSRMLLELTLIDNRTGYTLWHARQELAADPTRPADVQRAVRTLLASLPPR